MALPEGTTDPNVSTEAYAYLPPSHSKALRPDVQVVTGMRGAGKTFWWHALQSASVRTHVANSTPVPTLDGNTEIHIGFGETQAPRQYPDMDTLRSLLDDGFKPRLIWRTVLLGRIAAERHAFRREGSWKARVVYVCENPEKVARALEERDVQLDQDGRGLIVLFDALDRCAEDWETMYSLIRGLLQNALQCSGYRRLRVKVFLRSDQAEEERIGSFPDASKVLSKSVELGWPPDHLYRLLWQILINGERAEQFRSLLPTQRDGGGVWRLKGVLGTGSQDQREAFHRIAGEWMGRDPRRGFPYTWIPNHLGDALGRVSPRSFLAALRHAAEDTAERYAGHEYALHYESIKQGVRRASEIRVKETAEDYPWVRTAFGPLAGMSVPLDFREIKRQWSQHDTIGNLRESAGQVEVRLPPRHLDEGAEGLRIDLEDLGIFRRLLNGRVNVPDVYRVGFRLGRKGGVKPVR